MGLRKRNREEGQVTGSGIIEGSSKRMCSLILPVLVLLLSSSPLLAASDWTFYATDKEGRHLYQKAKGGKESPGITRVWDELIYTPGGKAGYLEKRKRFKHRIEGLEDLTYRMVLYELNCFSERREYRILEVFEMDGKARILDYARAGSYKDWQDIPEGSSVALLHSTTCPAKRTEP